MENNYSYSGSGVQTAQVTLMKSLYLWMSVALAVTGITYGRRRFISVTAIAF